jgi:hypothetical protein
MITAGKLFIGNFVLTSDCYAANTTGFMNRDISNDRAGRYFDIIGLGMQARWQQERWYVSMGFADVKAEDSVRLAFQHDYADQAEYALYGRDTWRIATQQALIAISTACRPFGGTTGRNGAVLRSIRKL